jgi:ribosomal protein S25
LWHEQLGETWLESGKTPFSWPVLVNDDERWAVRAVIDAVVADAYGLSREQYAHVLSTFSHASYPAAPDLCLARFDELKQIGLEAFCMKHDPYWDTPLVETLPTPVIDLPISDDGDGEAQPKLWLERGGQLTLNAPGPLFEGAESAKPKKKRASAGPASASASPDAGRVAAVRTLLELRKVVTSAEIQQQFGLDGEQARAILKHLADAGVATPEGKARGLRYRLANHV